MKKLTVKEIEAKLSFIEDQDHSFLQEIKDDERKSVQKLISKWVRRYQQKKHAEEKYVEMTRFEERLRNEGYSLIAGIDEVGRGPLAGPVVAASVILPHEFKLLGIDDSKKLTFQQREEFYHVIKEQAIGIGIGIIGNEEIDEINIFEATKKAMLSSIEQLAVKPEFLLVDAVKLDTPFSSEAIIKGDSRSISIAAASIIAKVTRDRIMIDLDSKFPQYQFAKNMGYGTKEHLLAIEKHGIISHHRKTFAPIKDRY